MELSYVVDIGLKVIEILVVVVGVGGVLFKLGRVVARFEIIGQQQSGEITELKAEVKALSSVLTAVAVQKVEMAGMREDISRLMNWYDELRHGKGIVG